MVLTIRAGKIEDLEFIKAIINHSTRELQRGFYKESEIEAALELVTGLEDLIQSQQYFVCESDGQLAGCGGVSLQSNDEKSAEIRGFFVSPEYARKGVASSVFAHCQRYCLEKGIQTLLLASTLSGEAFYRKLGFIEVDRFKQPLSNGQFFELVNMKKTLASSTVI